MDEGVPKLENLQNFYSTLFEIEITIFGIISAVIFVFIQLVYTYYSYNHIGQILKNKWLIIFYICIILSLILSAVGALVQTFSIQKYLLEITNEYIYGLLCLSLIFISLSVLTIFVIKNISFLQPHRAIFLLSDTINFKKIRDYLWHKYELELPYNLQFKFVFTDDLKEAISESYEQKIEESHKFQLAEDQKIEAINKEINKIKKKTTNAEDPFIPIRDMMIQFIKRYDLNSLAESKLLVTKIIKSFLSNIPKDIEKDWSPNNVLSKNFTQYILEFLSTILEIAEKEKLESAKKIILNICFEYSSECFNYGFYDEIILIDKFLLQVADDSIGKSSIVFIDIMNHYKDTGEKALDLIYKNQDQNDHQYQEIIKDVCKAIGWLGERLLTRLPLENSPLMMNFDYSTEYDSLLNCLFTFDHYYCNKLPQQYPLIFFDTIIVILSKLVLIVSKNNTNRSLGDHIFDLSYTFAEFAESAIEVGNSDGAALAALNLKEAYTEILDAKLSNLANDVLKSFIKIGMLAAGSKNLLKEVDFMDKPLDIWIADVIVNSGVDIEASVIDNYIHAFGVPDHDAIWEWIVSLGMRLRTNFGLSFDPETGQRIN